MAEMGSWPCNGLPVGQWHQTRVTQHQGGYRVTQKVGTFHLSPLYTICTHSCLSSLPQARISRPGTLNPERWESAIHCSSFLFVPSSYHTEIVMIPNACFQTLLKWYNHSIFFFFGKRAKWQMWYIKRVELSFPHSSPPPEEVWHTPLSPLDAFTPVGVLITYHFAACFSHEVIYLGDLPVTISLMHSAFWEMDILP